MCAKKQKQEYVTCLSTRICQHRWHRAANVSEHACEDTFTINFKFRRFTINGLNCPLLKCKLIWVISVRICHNAVGFHVHRRIFAVGPWRNKVSLLQIPDSKQGHLIMQNRYYIQTLTICCFPKVKWKLLIFSRIWICEIVSWCHRKCKPPVWHLNTDLQQSSYLACAINDDSDQTARCSYEQSVFN